MTSQDHPREGSSYGRRGGLYRALLWAGVVGLTVGAAGCLNTHNGVPQQGPQVTRRARGPLDAARPIAWRQVYVGSGSDAVHRGYLNEIPVLDGATYVHYVYDPDFNLRGRIHARGQTFQINRDGEAREVGVFDLDNALLRLYGYEDARYVDLRPMPPPRRG